VQAVCRPIELQALVATEERVQHPAAARQEKDAPTCSAGGGSIATAVVGLISAQLTMEQVLHLSNLHDAIATFCALL